MNFKFRASCPLLAWLIISTASSANEGTDVIEKKIRPVLAAKCYKCRSAEAARIGVAYRLLFARPPLTDEQKFGEQFIAEKRLDRYVHTLMCTNEVMLLN